MIQQSVIYQIFLRELHFIPETIIKKEVGVCNEVYLVRGNGGSFILRMNDKHNYMYGTCMFLPLLRSLKIKAPEIVAACSDPEICGYYYQIQTVIEGEDLECVMQDLTFTQIRDLAEDIGKVIIKFSSLPCESYFGAWTSMGEEKYGSQAEVLFAQLDKIVHRLSSRLSGIYKNLLLRNLAYFEQVSPNLYFDDIISKNVMIENGRFNGLVDLDFLRRGDILELIGRIQGCWESSINGEIFTRSILNILKLTQEEKIYVKVYAILNLINWISEDSPECQEMTKSVLRLYEGL